MISTTERAISYTADGVQTVFSFPYAIVEEEHLSISVDGTDVTNFTVALNTDKNTGCVATFTTAPTENAEVVLSRTTPITQLVDYTAGNAFNAETHEDALDKLTLILQEYQDDLGRAIRAPIGSTGQTRTTSAFFGKYLGFDANGDIVALDETVSSGSGSTFDMSNASDVDIISVSAAGTTTITIPDTKTAVFGAIVTASVGSGAYAHSIRLPAPASTGQRGFVRIKFDSAHDAAIKLEEDDGTDLFLASGGLSQYNSTIEVVANGTTWVVANIQRGDIAMDQFHGTTYVIPANQATTPNATELAAAAADSDPATIYIDNLVTFDSDDFVEIPARHRLVFGQGAGFNFLTGFAAGGSGVRIDCEVITASRDQPIFHDASPGVVIGNFGGQPRNVAWWSQKSTVPTLLYPDNWLEIQCAVYAADWETTGTSDTITNWNDSTEVITVADTSNFAEGDIVVFSGTLGSGIVAGRPYVVKDAVAGAGSTLSTFKIAESYNTTTISFGTGGSLDATVSRVKSADTFKVNLTAESYEIDRPVDWGGSGAVLDGKGGTITAIAGEWASDVVEVDTYAGGHSPMLMLGETSPDTWSGHACGVENLTLNGGDIDDTSGISSRGHIPQRSFVKNVEISMVDKHYVGWAKTWSARVGDTAANDTSYIDIENFTFEDAKDSASIPLHLPGARASLRNGSVSGQGSEQILYGANVKGISMRDVEWGGAYSLVNLVDDPLYLRVHLDNVAGDSTTQDTISVTSVDTVTNVFTATGHNFSDGDVLRATGVGTSPNGWIDANAYVVVNATANTFQVSDSPNTAAFTMTVDNGAFTVERPGVLIQFKSTQTLAKVTAVSLEALTNEVVLVDTGAHNLIVTAGDDRAIDTGRRADFIAWSSVGYSVIADGITRTRGLVLYDLQNQYTLPRKGDEIVLMSLKTITNNNRSFVIHAEDEDGSTRRWKYLDMNNNNQSFHTSTSDPEV